MDKIGIYAVPVIIVLILIFGLVRRVPVFDSFLSGAKIGFDGLISIIPSLVGLITAVTMLNASGFFDLLTECISPLMSFLGIEPELVPLGLLRPVSGSGSLALLQTIFEKYGADSVIGRTAAVISGSTETTFYAIAVYYGAVGIKKSRHTVPCALFSDLCGMILACLFIS